jgi:hypothetical protein
MVVHDRPSNRAPSPPTPSSCCAIRTTRLSISRVTASLRMPADARISTPPFPGVEETAPVWSVRPAIAGGVFDCLPNRWVTLSARSIWRTLLASNGSIIFTNSKRGNRFRVWLDYLANWSLIERDQREIGPLERKRDPNVVSAHRTR